MNKNVTRLIRKKRRMRKHYTSSKETARDYIEFEAYKKVQREVRKAERNAKKNIERKDA